jgi:peptidoglycan/LPS O-acetylase OafA/YrhL
LLGTYGSTTSYQPGKEPIETLGYFGVYGVQIFFIISGYVIPRSLHQSQYKLKRMGSYILRRAIRLDPPYYLSIFLVMGLTLLIQVASFYQDHILEFESRRVLSHFLCITMIIMRELG